MVLTFRIGGISPKSRKSRSRRGNGTPLYSVFSAIEKSTSEEVESVETDKDGQEDMDVLDFNPNIIYHPDNEEQLRKLYFDQLFHFQLKWASSTMMEKSNLDANFMRDSLLRSFTQQLPDSYLLFYYPILKVKKAPVELDILLNYTDRVPMHHGVGRRERRGVYRQTASGFGRKRLAIGNQRY